MSSPAAVPIRPSPQKLSGTTCVLLAPVPAELRPSPRSAAPRATRRHLPPPPGRALRRRGAYSAYVPSPQPTNVLRRNARERNRVKQVNHGFTALRNHIPGAAKNKKLSKVDTLRRAMEYIESLQRLLEEHSESSRLTGQRPSSSHQRHQPETQFRGYLSPAEAGPVSTAGSLTPPGYLPPREGQPRGYLTPQSSPTACQRSPPTACQPSPLMLTPSSLASADSGVGDSERLEYPAGASLPCSDTPSLTQPGYGSAPPAHLADYPYSEELSCPEPEADFSPEDEELLDAIAWWQSSQ